MASPRHNQRVLTEAEAERYRLRLRDEQARRHEARLTAIRRRNNWHRWGERFRAATLFAGIVVFFTWVYWLACHSQ